MNRLQQESSPYLLQHAHNPVDWYAWKPEAFERARNEQKPILVSIGYSTCHWCHVMERESFENEEVAALMNAHFINIKVDREERPDVDAIYMEACQLLTGGGGWPLNCFLTPDGKPFYAGTYFPPEPAHNRPSWTQLLAHLANIWAEKRSLATEQAEKLLANIQRNEGVFLSPEIASNDLQEGLSSPNADIPAEIGAKLYARLRESFDPAAGGFGAAPKFPATMALRWLLNWHHYSGNAEAREHALFSLKKMIQGGIYDQIGGGFARYTTDREWLIPHFEKMLYDNALLISVLAEAYKLDQDPQLARTITQTLDYISREMTHADGAFYAAQDADSEGVEGKFYVWDKAEVEAILGEDSDLFCAFYDVTEAGNWEEKNILWQAHDLSAFATEQGLDPDDCLEKLTQNGDKLRAVRDKRIWPGLDDKILLDWNALMISAYAAAFTALGKEEYRQCAVRALNYLAQNYRHNTPTQTGYSPWKHSAGQSFAFLDDYAFLIAACIDVHQITFESKYLDMAQSATAYVFEHFLDAETGLFFNTDVAQTDILFRKKNLYDNATPSGNSTMLHNLQRLGILLDRPDWRAAATGMLATMRTTIEKYPRSFERWAGAWLQALYPMHEIALVGENALEKALTIQRGFLPHKIIAASLLPDDTQPLLAGKLGATDALIYVCQDFACQKPVEHLDAFWALVNSR